MAQGSRNAQKANQKRVDQAKKNLENLKQQLQEEKSKPNKTPEDKERIDKIEKQINRENDRLKKSEEHAKKGRGN